jgi:hypothetical protein
MNEMLLERMLPVPFAREEPEPQAISGSEPQVVQYPRVLTEWLPHQRWRDPAPPGAHAEDEELIRAARRIQRIVAFHNYRGETEERTPSEFRLGQRATSILREGFRALVEDERTMRNVDLTADAAYLSDEEISKFGADSVEAAFASLAIDYAGAATSILVADRDGFKLSVEQTLLAEMPCRARDAGRLMSLIQADIVAFVRGGGTFGQGWGRVEVSSSRILLILNRPVTEAITKSRRTKAYYFP